MLECKIKLHNSSTGGGGDGGGIQSSEGQTKMAGAIGGAELVII